MRSHILGDALLGATCPSCSEVFRGALRLSLGEHAGCTIWIVQNGRRSAKRGLKRVPHALYDSTVSDALPSSSSCNNKDHALGSSLNKENLHIDGRQLSRTLTRNDAQTCTHVVTRMQRPHMAALLVQS